MAQSFKFNITIQANSQEQAMQKMEAHARIEKRLTPPELIRLGEIVETQPDKLQLAKQYLGV
jgi:hypothetical protein